LVFSAGDEFTGRFGDAVSSGDDQVTGDEYARAQRVETILAREDAKHGRMRIVYLTPLDAQRLRADRLTRALRGARRETRGMQNQIQTAARHRFSQRGA
jgi:hypothetical protein